MKRIRNLLADKLWQFGVELGKIFLFIGFFTFMALMSIAEMIDDMDDNERD